MATVDLNSDQCVHIIIHTCTCMSVCIPPCVPPSYDDLVVGAPMYSKIDSNTLQVEIGRVYVFINTRVSV